MTVSSFSNAQDVVVLLGAGAIAQAIARRVGVGKHIVCADLQLKNAQIAVETLQEAGFSASAMCTDIASREAVFALADHANQLGQVKYAINSAGVSPSQAPIATILKVDLYGTALFLEAFGQVIAPQGAGLVISSQSGHRLPALSREQDDALALTPTEELLDLPLLADVQDTLHAYQLSKRANALRIRAVAVQWAKRGARVNCISPGIIHTPLANDELNGERKEFYQSMLAKQPAGRGGTPDEVATVAKLLLSEEGGYITGSDFLMDGGATAMYFYGNPQ